MAKIVWCHTARILIAAAMLLSGHAPHAGAASATNERPNILVIFMDDLGWRDVGFMGSQFYETPNLDRFAGQSMVFTDAYVTAATCTPSRAGLFAGQYTPRTGIYCVNAYPVPPVDAKSREITMTKGNKYAKAGLAKLDRRPLLTHEFMNKKLPKGFVSFPTLLKAAGYRTGFAGKWHHHPGPEDHGFEEIMRVDGPRDPENDPKRMVSLTDAALDFIRRHEDERFLFFLSHHAPHVPNECRKALEEKYQTKTPVDGQDSPAYAGMIEQADAEIGRLLRGLKNHGIHDKTVVVFFSDHGGFTRMTDNAPLREGKGSTYEGGLRVPLVIRWPGVIQPGTRKATPVTAADLYPTLVEIGGGQLTPEHALDGVSLVPHLKGAASLPERCLYWHWPTYAFQYKPSGVIRRGDYKLIEFFEDDRLELYHLENDIGEKENLAENEPATTRELHELLKQWRIEVGAKVPQRNPNYADGS